MSVKGFLDTARPVDQQIAVKDGSADYVGIWQIGGQGDQYTLRITIRRDFYDHQCRGLVEYWRGSWVEVGRLLAPRVAAAVPSPNSFKLERQHFISAASDLMTIAIHVLWPNP